MKKSLSLVIAFFVLVSFFSFPITFSLGEDSIQREIITDTWEEIVNTIENGAAKERYAIGARKELDLGEYGIVVMQLVDFVLDDRADGNGKALTTWVANTLLNKSYRMNSRLERDKYGMVIEGTGGIGGWEKCELRRFLQEELFSSIPIIIRDKIVPVRKYQRCFDISEQWIDQVTEDRIWIPSADEMFSSYYPIHFRNRRKTMTDGTPSRWWLRDGEYREEFEAVYTDGDGCDGYLAYNEAGVAFGFCLAADNQNQFGSIEMGEISDSWEEIIANVNDGSAPHKYAIGAWKTIDLAEFGKIRMQLAGYDLDERADGSGKAYSTWIAKDLLSMNCRVNPSYEEDSNRRPVPGTAAIEGWGKSELRSYLNDVLFTRIPKELKEKVVCVMKRQTCFDSNTKFIEQMTEDNIWIPSEEEIKEKDSPYFQLFYEDINGRIVNRNTYTSWWWLRSGYSLWNFKTLNDSCDYFSDNPAKKEGGIVIGFCL